jgi:hypothetical protein
MLIFPMYKSHCTLSIVQPAERCNLDLEQGVMIRHCHTLYIVQPARNFLNRFFIKENTISSLRKSSSPFFLQEFGPLILLNTKDRFTSLTVIEVMEIMCNKLGLCNPHCA